LKRAERSSSSRLLFSAPFYEDGERRGGVLAGLRIDVRERYSQTVQRIVLAVGLPGSGKSSHLASIGAHPLSSDAIRELLSDDATDQNIHDRVFATIRYLLRHRLAIGRPVTYIDATNLTVRERQTWIGVARESNCEIEALYFDVPLEVCLARNRLRARRVPEDVIREMAGKLTAPQIDEGYSRVEIVGP
jgi:predicted kinase